ncbi:flocculation-associated PEP-CTERM protein PepA [Herbaspirillum sp. SJZ107]|uniref:flocculation-associated PEP-CTERM protein PepA n=1 Tax=Herbaspirillum sp. SJZ107 TaxID=2572881 RepID=UPI001154AFC5|nr:flocculation-associated PEP-CTERM protein PepA [Herbaspirillum sp. SJZ107]TQK05222.1 putative secreted protein with PEP-CTERM sorting signal [Herbaspirillum sp. SJZ107]
MKFLKKLSCAAAVALSMAGAAHAEDVLQNWVFNPVGGGYSSGQTIGEYLDVNGNAFIQIANTGNNTFSFQENAVFNIVQADSNGLLFPVTYPGGNITATFAATGSGTFSGAFQFTGGTINIYQDAVANYGSTTGIYGADDGKLIASFDVLVGGGGNVDASGNPISNGQVTVYAKANAGDLASGYFFRENGQDLSSEDILAFAFTNANGVSNITQNLVSEVACQFGGYTGAGCTTGTTYTPTPGQNFFVSNNGQFKLAEVPEPGSLALFGIAMLGAGVAARKRNKKA